MSTFKFHSGRLRHEINVLYIPDGTDDNGEQYEPTLLFADRANVKVVSGGQLERYGTVLTSSVISVLMRYNDALQYDHIIEWEGKQYSVDHIAPDVRNRCMVVTAEVITK